MAARKGRGKLANFHGRKAAPFRKGGARRGAIVPPPAKRRTSAGKK